MAAVKTVSLTKEYSNGEHYLRAVDDISFTVEENEFVAIMGSSGCGKTTLLNLLGGLENPTHGCVYINDVDITQLSMEERSSFRRWHIGFIFQNFKVLVRKCVGKVISLTPLPFLHPYCCGNSLYQLLPMRFPSID